MKVENTDGRPIKMWTDRVQVEDEAMQQLRNVAQMPFIYKWVCAMPDVHAGMGATIGSVIPTQGAVIPAAVGVDLGCGICAQRTTLTESDVPKEIRHDMRLTIEAAVPAGRTKNGGPGDIGAWNRERPGTWEHQPIPAYVENLWYDTALGVTLEDILADDPDIKTRYGLNAENHLGTLGTGNHFIEVCLDEEGRVWLMLHSGSRGVGNRIGAYFIKLAKAACAKWYVSLPDPDLAFFPEHTSEFDRYMRAAEWAQMFAKLNRMTMMKFVREALQAMPQLPDFEADGEPVNCHHNYVAKENHYGKNVLVTRKGAIRAQRDELAIIPGSMGARSYIVRGLGNSEAFCSASHGAGRAMSRTEARKTFTVQQHQQATAGIECDKSESVLDETPGAYKDIDKVMASQTTLVEPVHTLRQIICVKGADDRGKRKKKGI